MVLGRLVSHWKSQKSIRIKLEYIGILISNNESTPVLEEKVDEFLVHLGKRKAPMAQNSD